MTYSHEMNMLANVNIGEIGSVSKISTTGLNNINRAMKAFGLDNSSAYEHLNKTLAALKITNGAIKIVGLIRSRIIAKQAIEDAKLAASIAINSTNPIGWGKIAIGAAAAVGVSVGLTATISKINAGSFDLSSPLGRSGAADKVNEVVANV